MKTRSVSLALCVVFIGLCAVSVAASDDPPGAAAGRVIGNGVRAAIETALPGVSSLIEAIWPKKTSNGNDKQTKDAVRKQVEAYQKSLANKVNGSLKSTTGVIAQLGLVNDFSKACDAAALSVLQLRFWLAASPEASAARQWSLIDEEWTVAAGAMDELKDRPISGVDSYVTDTFKRVQQARGNLLVRIDGRRKDRDAVGMNDHLVKLQTLLEATRNLTTYQITQVKAAFETLSVPVEVPSDGSTPPPLPPPAPASKETEQFMQRVDRLLRSAGV